MIIRNINKLLLIQYKYGIEGKEEEEEEQERMQMDLLKIL